MRIELTNGQTLSLNDFIFTNKPGDQARISSREVARIFKKRHKNVLRDIESLEVVEDFNGLNFEPVDYVDKKGETRPEYHMTKDGCMYLIMGYTGKYAAEIKVALIRKFREAEKRIAKLEKQYADATARLNAAEERAVRDNYGPVLPFRDSRTASYRATEDAVSGVADLTEILNQFH